jgi:hydrogenase maturation protease
MKHVLIGGIGSVLLGDDAAGPYLVQLLAARYEFEAGVEVIDLGTPSLDLLELISGKDAVILIDCVNNDCVDAEEAPGKVLLYRREEIVCRSPGVRMDPHSPALVETLLTADFLGTAPRNVLLVGIVAKSFEAGSDLSDPLKASLDHAIAQILSELDRLHVTYKPREKLLDLGIWWASMAAFAAD